MGCLYSIKSPSGKRYIGISSKTAERRWHVHQMRVKEGRDQALQRAIRKYGADKFLLETLVIADDWGFLCDLERKAIKAYGSKFPTGYNLTDGGEGVIGKTVSEETRKKMSESQKRRFATQDQSERLEKLRAVNASKRKPDGYKAPWQLRRMNSMARVGSDEHREKISVATRAAVASPEMRAKISEARRASWANPDSRERRLEQLAKARKARRKA